MKLLKEFFLRAKEREREREREENEEEETEEVKMRLWKKKKEEQKKQWEFLSNSESKFSPYAQWFQSLLRVLFDLFWFKRNFFFSHSLYKTLAKNLIEFWNCRIRRKNYLEQVFFGASFSSSQTCQEGFHSKNRQKKLRVWKLYKKQK